jgi:hypothetical protein
MQTQTDDHLLIQGDFVAPGRERFLRGLTRLGGVLLTLCIVLTMVIYGFKVHLEDSVNQLARNTRELNEENKELQVKLNHIRSFKNVETAASHMPRLRLPPTVLNIPVSTHARLPQLPRDSREFPHVYGY